MDDDPIPGPDSPTPGTLAYTVAAVLIFSPELERVRAADLRTVADRLTRAIHTQHPAAWPSDPDT